jgi:DNA-directed RNA polymerase subunit RPC12/RpoP
MSTQAEGSSPKQTQECPRSQLAQEIERLFLHVLGLEESGRHAGFADPSALDLFIGELFGDADPVERPALVVDAQGIPVGAADPEDIVRAYAVSGRLAVRAGSAAGGGLVSPSHLDTVCAQWAADHLGSASPGVVTRATELVSICPSCIQVYAYHSRATACPACGSRFVVKPLQERRESPQLDARLMP